MSRAKGRTLRGGGWYYNRDGARSFFRDVGTFLSRNFDLGIRLVEVVDDAELPPVERSYRVNRGGSWRSGPRHCAGRSSGGPGFRYFSLGVRLVEVTDD